METRVYLGKKPEKIKRLSNGKLSCKLPPQLELSMPLLFSAMSYGSISYNAHKSLALAATELGILYNTGEGGLHEDFYCYGAVSYTHLDVYKRQAPNIMPNPTNQNAGVPIQKSIKFFIRILPVFLALVNPASQSEKPACIKNTNAARCV